MEQLYEYREHLLDRYAAAAREFRSVVSSVPDPHQPLKEDEWNVHQLAVHTRDVDKLVYGMRIRRTLAEENPLFENFDGEAWMEAHYSPDESLQAVLSELVASVEEAVALLRKFPPQAWIRPSRHAAYGDGFTPQSWVERALAHIEEHLKSARR